MLYYALSALGVFLTGASYEETGHKGRKKPKVEGSPIAVSHLGPRHPDLASDQRLELIEQLQGAIDDLQPIQEITKGRVERFVRKYRIGVTFRGAIQCVIRTTDIVAAIEQENMARTGEAGLYDESWA